MFKYKSHKQYLSKCKNLGNVSLWVLPEESTREKFDVSKIPREILISKSSGEHEIYTYL